MIQKITFSTIALCLLFASCATKKNNQAEADCPSKPCTMEFRTVGVIFKDSKGDTLLVKDFSVKLKSNNKVLPSATSETPIPDNPYYLIANDGDKSVLHIDGDTLIVSAKHPSTDQVKTSEVVVSGGRCECHINKISGTEEIVFD